jgi:glycerol-3-phosphate O-acyltransferase/dihydroxyacetone phosphate acyltransferase
MALIGRVLSFVVGGAVEVFYRHRIIEGAIPAHGPVLLVANHPNALLDPVVVMNAAWRTGRRRVRMLAKAPLFSMPGVSVLVKGLDCLPVYRAKDGADTKANAQTFRAVEDALCAGSAVLIFPEGISHDEPSVQPLKTGAARMALAALGRGANDLVVVPVGLSYADKLRFRSTAAVEIGPALRVADFAAAGAVDSGDVDVDADAVRRLTEAIAAALKEVTVNLESWEDLPLLTAIDAIWRQDDPERSRRLKNLADGTARARVELPAAYDDLRSRLSEWLERLERLGLKPHDVADEAVVARRDPAKLASFLLRNFLAATFAFPLALLGALFWFVPFWAVHLVFLASRVEKDTGASVKVLSGLVFFPAWYAAAVAGLAAFVDPGAAVAAAVVAPGAGLTTRHFFRRRFFAAEQAAKFVKLSLQGQMLADLIRERDAFCRDFDAVAAHVNAGDAAAASAGNRPAGSAVLPPSPA